MDMKKDLMRGFVYILLSIDMFFIVASIINLLTDIDFSYLSVDIDRGSAEYFQYYKFVGIAFLSFLLFLKKKSVIFLFFSGLNFYLYYDDSRLLHEFKGGDISRFIFGYPDDVLFAGITYSSVGELLYMFFMGIMAFLCIFFLLKFTSKKEIKFIKKIVNLLFIFCLFAVGVDLVRNLLISNVFIYKLMAIIEDGGEMISISFICYCFFKKLYDELFSRKLEM